MTGEIPPGTAAANLQMLKTVNERLEKLSVLENTVDQKLADPAYSTPNQQQQLANTKLTVQKAKNVLSQEKVIREDLATHSGPGFDSQKALTDLTKLNGLRRNTYPTYYKKGAKVGDPCIPCLSRDIAKVRAALMPQTTAEAAETITGIFEGGKPNYCALADSQTDAGGLSYGKHQASETSGNLKAMLELYSMSIAPAPDTDLKLQIDRHLQKFSTSGKAYAGSAAERVLFKDVLRKACKDQAMQNAQDSFFARNFWDPSARQAAKYGVNSSLGQSMYYDMQIQGPAFVDGFSKRALAQWSSLQKVSPPAEACAPLDPRGPDEKTFLYLVNEERRKHMQKSETDYRNTTYRPDAFDRQLDFDNLDLSKDFEIRGQPIEGLPMESPLP